MARLLRQGKGTWGIIEYYWKTGADMVMSYLRIALPQIWKLRKPIGKMFQNVLYNAPVELQVWHHRPSCCNFIITWFLAKTVIILLMNSHSRWFVEIAVWLLHDFVEASNDLP